MSETTHTPQRRGRWTLVLLFAIGVLPMILAYGLYQQTIANGEVWKTTNHGNLVTPAQPVQSFTVLTADNIQRGLSDLETHWTLVQFGGRQCTEPCRQTLYNLRQLHTLLNKDQDRLQRWLVVEGQAAAFTDIEQIRSSYPLLTIAALVEGQLLAQLSEIGSLNETLYLIDPMGNIMMTFPVSMEPKKMLKDIKKLLRISQVG